MKNIALTETSYQNWLLSRPVRCCIVLLGGLLMLGFTYIARMISSIFLLLGLGNFGYLIAFFIISPIIIIWYRLHGPLWKSVLGFRNL